MVKVITPSSHAGFVVLYLKVTDVGIHTISTYTMNLKRHVEYGGTILWLIFILQIFVIIPVDFRTQTSLIVYRMVSVVGLDSPGL